MERKYIIRFSPDYGATSLWPVNEEAKKCFSMPIKYEELLISDSLKMGLEKFDNCVMNTIDWNNPGNQSLISGEEVQMIYENGLKLIQLLREELGHEYEIIEDFDWIKDN